MPFEFITEQIKSCREFTLGEGHIINCNIILLLGVYSPLVCCVLAHLANEDLTTFLLGINDKNTCTVNILGRQRLYLPPEQRVCMLSACYKRTWVA